MVNARAKWKGGHGEHLSRHRRGSLSPIFRSISVVLLSKDGLGSEEQNRKNFEKKNKERAHAQAKWRGGPPTGSILPVSHSNCVKTRSNCVYQSIEQSQVRKKAKKKRKGGGTHREEGRGGPTHTPGGFHLSGPCLLALPNPLGDPVNGGRKKKKKSKKKKGEK